MKKQILFLSIVALSCTALIFTACQKDSKSDNNDNSAEVSVQSDDQSRFSNETDQVANEVDASLETEAGFGRGGTQLICDATITSDTTGSARVITITYNGTNCLGTRTRTGVVTISMPQGVRWKNAGATITVNFQNLKITRVSDNKSITINGTQTITNVSGGLLISLPALGTITHTITSSNMSITFDNGTQRTWSVARQRVYAWNAAAPIITITGTHTEGNVTGVAEWGTNRFGRTFITAITQPLVISQACNYRLISGKVTNVNALATTTVTFGLDVSGNPVSCPAGVFYFKITWTGPNGNTITVIMPY